MHIRERITCADGTTLSVQASAAHYCIPKIDGAERYVAVEVGFPSAMPPDSWEPYCDGDFGEPCEQVYAFVPVHMVIEFIQSHGGFAIEIPQINW